MIEPFHDFLKGPAFIFCFAVAVLGTLRLAFLHMHLLATALYNSWSEIRNRQLLLKNVFKSLLPTFAFRADAQLILRGLFGSALFLLPLMIFEHQSILTDSTGITLIAFSTLFAQSFTLVCCFYIGIRLWKSFRALGNMVGALNDVGFWGLLLVVVGSGFLSSKVTHIGLLLFIQTIHLCTVNTLLFLVPFSRIGYLLVYPLATITSHLGFSFLPHSAKRNETELYFQRLMENR